MVSLTVIIQVIFIQLAVKGLKNYAPKLIDKSASLAPIILLTCVTLWLFAALSLSIWIWAGAFTLLGAYDTIEQALYFSMVAFTTLGFGDVILPRDWRLLSGVIAANGLVLFGLNTAFLIEALRKILLASSDE